MNRLLHDPSFFGKNGDCFSPKLPVRKTIVVLLGVLLALLPFHPFLITALEGRFFPDVPGVVRAWKEILLVLVAGLSLLLVLSRKEFFQKWNALALAVSLFVVVSLGTGILFTGNGFPDNVPQIAFGAKYGLLFLIVLVLFSWVPIRASERMVLENIALAAGAIVVLFGALQVTVLPENFLVQFGYNAQYGNIHPEGEISYCHKIENSITNEEFCRAQSTLSGPNQFGAYLLLFLPLLFFRLRKTEEYSVERFFMGIITFCSAFALLMTWSRSAWIGALAMLGAVFVFQARRPGVAFSALLLFLFGTISLFAPAFLLHSWDHLKPISLAFASVSAISLVLLSLGNLRKGWFVKGIGLFFAFLLAWFVAIRSFFDTFFWNILLRPSSSQGHWERWKDGVEYMIRNPFGLGLGDAGPASARFAHAGETGFLPESWYLQVGLESGFLGLALFLTILILLGKALFLAKNDLARAMLFSLIGISTAAFFLHTWESSAVAYSFAILAAIGLSAQEEPSLFQRIFKKITLLFERNS